MKLPVGSHTYIDTLARCPKQAWHKYVVKDQPLEETKELKWGNAVHSALEARCGRDNALLPSEMQSYEKYALTIDALPMKRVELKLGMRKDGKETAFFNTDDVWFRGKADVLSVQDNKAFLVDWKTGKKREDPSELEEHALLVKARWPQVDSIHGCYVWLKDDEMGKVHDLSHFSVTFERVQRLMNLAETMMSQSVEWPARENPLCGWCSVKTCKYNPRNEA